MKHRYLHSYSIPFLCLFLLVWISNGHAQNQNVQIEPQEIDYGETEKWLSRIDTILITNKGNEPISLLKRQPPDHTQIEWPEGTIEPGSSAIIRMVYAPKTRGPFHVKIPVYYSAAPEPITIHLRGNVVSFAENAFTACPTLGKEETEVSFLHRGIVLDSLTSQPIEEATVTISTINENKETNEDGVYEKQIPIGRYTVTASAKHYETKDTTVYLNRNNPFLRFELPRTEQAPVSYMDKEESSPLEEQNKEPSVRSQPSNPPPAPAPQDTTHSPKEDELPSRQAEEMATREPEDTVLLPVNKYKPNNVVFLIDVSTSMDEENKLPWLKLSITNMVRHLREIDKITIVSYATVSHMVLPTTTADKKDKIYEKVNGLEARGRTKASRGLKKAYKEARDAYIEGGNNQVIIASDGEFEELTGSRTKINMKVRWNAFRDINLSVVGFGQDDEALEFMEGMAEKGNGSTLLIKDKEQAKKALLQEIKQNARRTSATTAE